MSGLRPSELLAPLTPLYRAGLGVKEIALARGWLRQERLASPVISVGNLSVGGSGKTPLVIYLAGQLSARGYAVDVLSRGYGRSSVAVERVLDGVGTLEGGLSAARRWGDEPVLIARSARVPVFVGARRYAAGLMAEQQEAPGPRVHLLDDGFQHRQLVRDVDIVVLRRPDFTERLLPAGRLREPLAALRRAHVAVIRAEDEVLAGELRRRGFELPVWRMVREMVVPEEAKAVPVVAFAGIAHPGEFFEGLKSLGVRLAGAHAFADHHDYTGGQIEALVASVKACGAGVLLTTEKDLVRLPERYRERLEASAVLRAVPLRARLLDEEAALGQLLDALENAGRIGG